jgi:microcystin-dependent protein
MGLFFYKWSKTAASNATADSNVNMAEGMAPSAVNDGVRALMASAAGFRDDISGAITTGGTSTAYTVTSNQVFDSLANMDGKVIAFTPHATNTAGSPNVTLNVDSLGAKSLRCDPTTELVAGQLVAGTPYVATYNNSSGLWLLQNFFGNPYNIPIGGGLPYIGSTAPNSAFVFPYGQAVSRTTYSALFTLVSTTYGTGDGSTTFNLPDWRGRVLAGKDDMGGSAASRLTSTYFGGTATSLGAVGGSESHTLTSAQMPTHTHSVTDPGHSHSMSNGAAIWTQPATGSASQGGNFGPFVVSTIASNTTGISIQNAGSGGAHNNVQPTIICNYIIRII